MSYPTSTGRGIAEIGAWAARLANEALDAGRRYDLDMTEQAASAVTSVAVVQVVGPMSPGNVYAATRSLVGDFKRGYLTGAVTATWSLETFEHSDAHRTEHADRLTAVADVIEASGIVLDSLIRCVAELRAYVAVYRP